MQLCRTMIICTFEKLLQLALSRYFYLLFKPTSAYFHFVDMMIFQNVFKPIFLYEQWTKLNLKLLSEEKIIRAHFNNELENQLRLITSNLSIGIEFNRSCIFRCMHMKR